MTYRLIILWVFFSVQVAANEVHKGPIAIAIHGGAGTITQAALTPEQDAAYRAALEAALIAGYEELKTGQPGQVAVVKAIQLMEQSPLFNAGIGSVYTYDGVHELDASIMHGLTREAGAVAGVTNIKSPIAAALAVMESSPHVLLTGKGAEVFAQQQGLTVVDNSYFNTDRRRRALQRAKQHLDQQTSMQQLFSINAEYKFGTVGVVVLDSEGNLVAGTSTGGMTAKRYGRVGDSPIIGAGTFADNSSCAVSATGHGEYFIRYNVAADICARMQYQKLSLAEASDVVINQVLKDAGGDGGVVAVDFAGNVAMPFNTEGMYRASIDSAGVKVIAIYREE
ncbi:isoaspartyl peptidase/L-asparaginase [Alteromonas sp. ASW11-36]|uniref:Isoaspartyl peptidase/L-asparaginase n=1 Tax=Alteromonas arenosi TaxID=3055817 RepID=A0ABT7SZU6_9ALTE|nr:isoaspartyl peptidase/L-asparaginase [Alteromonas sp. ASW11-36]MDM7861059.1 isoaspartyl peptidase/L-asparaginase [Alteromonas sp. ASW11-36]